MPKTAPGSPQGNGDWRGISEGCWSKLLAWTGASLSLCTRLLDRPAAETFLVLARLSGLVVRRADEFAVATRALGSLQFPTAPTTVSLELRSCQGLLIDSPHTHQFPYVP